MILYMTSIVIFLFVAFSLFWRTDCALWIKITGCVIIFLISMKYVCYKVIGGAFFSPHLPRYFILTFETLYGALIILFFLLLLWDIYLAGNWILSRAGFPTPSRLPRGAIKCGLCFLALLLGIWGAWQAVKVPNVRRVEMRVPNLPQGLDGFSIVQLSDMHVGPLLKKGWLAQVVAKTNALKPNLIVLTGDYVDGTVEEIGKELLPLADLNAEYGVYAVTGNHEYYWNMPEWKEAINNLGVEFLENEHKNLLVNGDTLVVAGIPDINATRFGFKSPDAKAALKDAPQTVRLLLAHQPKNARVNAEAADIILSGHTHGGQMFFLQPLIAKFNGGFVNGEYPVDGKILYVSPGTGVWNGFSCRIGAPSEITNIILRPAQQF